jgi:hypothetical protein
MWFADAEIVVAITTKAVMIVFIVCVFVFDLIMQIYNARYYAMHTTRLSGILQGLAVKVLDRDSLGFMDFRDCLFWGS